jgi:HEAT repeat protein
MKNNMEQPEIKNSEEVNSKELLGQLIELAKNNQDEDWEIIDGKLGNYSDEEEFLKWSKKNLSNEDSGLRDLAASILERSKYDLEDSDIDNLIALMNENDEENPYPSFRAACALAKRGIITKDVINKLEFFVQDDNVSEIAKSYLEKIKSK